jgi:hypothetical protein
VDEQLLVATVQSWCLEWRCAHRTWPGWLLKYGSDTTDLMFFWDDHIDASIFDNDAAWAIFTTYGYLDAIPAPADAVKVDCP